MLVKKFFINTGIIIALKMNNGSYSRGINQPHTITLASPNFKVFLTHWRNKRSPLLPLTKFLTSDTNKLNSDTLLKWTIFNCSSVHRICSMSKSRRTFWFFFEIKGLWHVIRGTNFSLLNIRETVFLESGSPVCSQNARKIDVAASKRFFKDILTTIRPSGLVGIGSLPTLSFGSSILSALNLPNTR